MIGRRERGDTSSLVSLPSLSFRRSSQSENVNKNTAGKVSRTLEEQAIHLSKARLAGRTKWYLERNPRIWEKKTNSDVV